MTTDINGVEIIMWDSVLVPDPNETDIHQHEFVGVVTNILSNGNVIVRDGDDNYFEIESERLEISND